MTPAKNTLDVQDLHKRAQAWHSLAALQAGAGMPLTALFCRLPRGKTIAAGSYSGQVPTDCLTQLQNVMD